MAKSFDSLKEKMSPESRERSRAKAAKYRSEDPVQVLLHSIEYIVQHYGHTEAVRILLLALICVDAELAALAQKRDEDIDTSDIPEVKDWSGAVVGKFYRQVKEAVSIRLDADILAWFNSMNS